MRPPDWATIVSAVVGGSLHRGKHQSTVGAFLQREAARLNRLPAAFFSVSLSAGSRNPAEVAAARDIALACVRSAQWTPERLVCFAGKLAYARSRFAHSLADAPHRGPRRRPDGYEPRP